MIIRQATADDSDAVWPLVRAFATSVVPDRQAFLSSWHQLIDADAVLALVADDEGEQVVGYLLAITHPTFFANGSVAWIEEVMVAESHRRTGVGRLLMKQAEEWASHNNATYIALATRRAGAFYAALGYEDSAVFFKKSLL